MYRDSNSLRCLDATACRVGNGIITHAKKNGDDIFVLAKRIGEGINAKILRLNEKLLVKTNRIGEGLIANCSTICTFNKVEKEKYTELEYIESTGTQYINTGLLSTSQSVIDIEFSFTTMAAGGSNNAAVFGGRNAQTSKTFTLFKLASTNPQYFRFDYNGQRQIGTSSQLTWDELSRYRFIYDSKTVSIANTVTNEMVSYSLNPSNLYTTSPICLFCVNTNGTMGTFMKGRIYRCMYSDGSTTIELIPALDENGIACMYDIVSGEFFYNQGKGDFLYELKNK